MVKFYTKGKSVKVELQTKAGNKFLKNTINQELKSYTNKFEIEFAEVEDAIVSERVLERIIELCESTELKLVGSKNELLFQLKNKVKIGMLTKLLLSKFLK